MKIKHVSQVVWRFYSDGRPKATAQTLSQGDITQACILSFADLARQTTIKSKQVDDSNEPDYSFLSPLLTIRTFDLGEANYIGMRRAEMCDIDLIRLPKNAHFTNVYPVGNNCDGDIVGDITQVAPGEENFYLSSDFSSFKFFVVKGRGLNTYHIPPCIKKIDVEAPYITDDIDLSLDMAANVVSSVLGMSIKVNGIPIKVLDNPYSPQPREIKHRLQETEQNI